MSNKPKQVAQLQQYQEAKRFRSLGELGRGGVGNIEVAADPVIGRRVAIKTLHEEFKDDQQSLARFGEEAQVTGQLEHPNVVPIYDLGQDENGQFIVMKMIKGKSLSQLLQAQSAQPRDPSALQGLVSILLRLCDALSYAHSRGVVHCDIKPDNVMVADHGQVYLMDWGVALLLSHRAVDERVNSLKESGEVPVPNWRERPDSFIRLSSGHCSSTGLNGTPAYMAPEQLLGQTNEIDERTDIFGMGGLLYEILLGFPPNNQQRFLNRRIHTPLSMPTESLLWTHLPPGLCATALKALSPAREERHQSIDELREELEQFLNGGGWFETKVFEAGASIVREAEPGDAAYIIESGTCEVFKLIDGKQVLVRQLGPGDVFGETAVFTGALRTASVVAKERSTLKVITGPSLTLELDRNPWLAAFVRSLAQLFREADERLSRVPETYSEKQ